MTGVNDELEALTSMPPAQLRALWRESYRTVAPPVGPDLLRRGIAHRLQERALGGLAKSARSEIERLRRRVERTGEAVKTQAIALKTGTRLVRTWKDKTYHVLVCDTGFQFEGRKYASLTNIAEAITGPVVDVPDRKLASRNRPFDQIRVKGRELTVRSWFARLAMQPLVRSQLRGYCHIRQPCPTKRHSPKYTGLVPRLSGLRNNTNGAANSVIHIINQKSLI
jgi:hypothetical protein